MTAAITGTIRAAGIRDERAELETALSAANDIIHVLLTRHGGEALITAAELAAARGSWLTVQHAEGGLIVRAR